MIHHGYGFDESDVAAAVGLIKENHPILYDILVQAETKNEPELLDGGIPLIRALNKEGFEFGNVGNIFFAVECRRLILRRHAQN